MSAPRFLVVVPAYNEEATIETVVRGALEHAAVCVVDDGSRDRTPEILARLPGAHVITHRANTHLAGAVLDGLRFALRGGHDYAITMDAGLSHDPADLLVFLRCEPADLVIGARDPARTRDVPWGRRLLSRGGTFLMNAILRGAVRDGPRRLRDCTSGYRRYSRRAMEILTAAPIRSRAFDFMLESLAVLVWAGCSVREVPISYRFTRSSLDRRVVREALWTWWRLRGEGARRRRDPALSGPR